MADTGSPAREPLDSAWARCEGALGEWGHVRSITRSRGGYEGVIASGSAIRIVRQRTFPETVIALADTAEEWSEE